MDTRTGGEGEPGGGREGKREERRETWIVLSTTKHGGVGDPDIRGGHAASQAASRQVRVSAARPAVATLCKAPLLCHPGGPCAPVSPPGSLARNYSVTARPEGRAVKGRGGVSPPAFHIDGSGWQNGADRWQIF